MSHIILPNTNKLWKLGISLSLYSRDYDWYSHEQEFTNLGRAVYEYKYFKNITDERRSGLVELCVDEAVSVLNITSDQQSVDFDACIAVPSNREIGHSLPEDLAEELCQRFSWIKDYSASLFKNRPISTLKNLTESARQIELKGAYSITNSNSFSGTRGFLIIDDIYGTGSTMREVCRTLKKAYPDIPRYVLTICHLRSVWSQQR